MTRFLYDNNIRFRLARHILFFSITVLFFSCVFVIQAGGEKSFLHYLWVTFINALFFFGYAYITLFILIPEFLLRMRFFPFVMMFLIVGVGLSTIKLITSGHIFYSDISPENIESTGFINLRYILVNTKDMSFIVALFCVTKYAKDYFYTKNQMRHLTSKYLEAQNKLLQLQFDPHFLFNTMNNLYSLSLSDSEMTREIIRKFKTVIAHLVDEGKKQFVNLDEELDLVRNFIGLQSLRYDERLEVELKIPENPEKYKIPSMILFFLIENCYRHGSSPDAGKPWIKLIVDTSEKRLLISAKNSKPSGTVELNKNGKKGFFFQNLTKRLSILMGENGYSLKIKDHTEYFEVNLELKSSLIEN